MPTLPETSPRLALPLIQPAQAQKHVTHNEAIDLLDLVVQLAVEAFDATDPPGEPAPGGVWALGAAPTGDWAGAAGALARRGNGGWVFVAPRPGWLAWGQDGTGLRVWTGSAWAPVTENLAGLGIGTGSDPVNRLAVAGAATLLTHAGTGGHQLKLNKAAPADTASLLFQTGWSGRAEMGTAGSDAFAIKVSADGTAWQTAASFDAATGAAALAPGLTVGGAVAYHRGNLVGTVAQSGGVPTGAVIEQGANANGDYTRWADGTQICARRNWVTEAGGGTWTFPAGFAATASTSVTVVSSSTAVPRVATGMATSALAASVRLFDLAGAGVAAGVSTIAYGRWF